MKYTVTTGVLVVVALAAGYFFAPQASETLGGVTQGNEYNGTAITALTTGASVCRTGASTFGAVTIMRPATAGEFSVYDATSTAATTTANRKAQFDASDDAAGTYTFDINMSNGVVFDATPDFDGVYMATCR